MPRLTTEPAFSVLSWALLGVITTDFETCLLVVTVVTVELCLLSVSQERPEAAL